MKIIMAGILLCIVMVMGCHKVESSSKSYGEIQYVKDIRTGLCFAYHYSYGRFGMAEVSCDVLKNVYVRKCHKDLK